MQKIRIYTLVLVLCLLLSACDLSAFLSNSSETEAAEGRSFTAEDLVGTSWYGQKENASCTLTFGQTDVYVRSFTEGRLLPEEYTLSWKLQQEDDGMQLRIRLNDMLCGILTYVPATDRLMVVDYAGSQILIPTLQPIDMINTDFSLALGTWECFRQEIFGEGQEIAPGECTLVVSGTEDAYTASYTDTQAPDQSFSDEKLELYLADYYEGYYVRVAGEVILGDEFTGSYSFCILEDGTLRLQTVQLPDGEGDPIYISRWFRRAEK